MAIGLPGQLADLNPRGIDSKLAEGGAIDFGVVVSRGTGDDQAVIGGADPIGVTLRSIDREGEADGSIEYAETEAMAVLFDGAVYCTIADAGAPGDALLYNTLTGAIGVGAPAGDWVALDFAELKTTVGAGEIGKLRIKR